MPSKNAVRDLGEMIPTLRGQRVILDSDLAELYGVPTSRLNEQVKRNADRFPVEFAFPLTRKELTILISQSATSSFHGGRRKLPTAFTEHGVLPFVPHFTQDRLSSPSH